MQRGQRGPLPRPIDPAAMEALWSPQEKAGVQRMLAATATGSPATVRTKLAEIIDATRADELIVACAVHEHAARLASYRLLAALAI
jgi:alkanesulfonate monooxygenase SsuD/methylene tetrahydromethanopterin reductase-like flavin-dependent oxidoreductase (luciferase family)